MQSIRVRSLANGTACFMLPRHPHDLIWVASGGCSLLQGDKTSGFLPGHSLSFLRRYSVGANEQSSSIESEDQFIDNHEVSSSPRPSPEKHHRSQDRSGRGTPSASLTSSEKSTEQNFLELPPIPRVTQEDEQCAHREGHFFRRLQESGLLDASGRVTEYGETLIPPMGAQYIHVAINKMVSMNKRYQTVLAVLRDVGKYMSVVNLVTAMHRLGRLVRRLRNPAVAERLMMHPEYVSLIHRTEESIESMEPRALANFLWAMAALGDRQHVHVVLKCVERLKHFSPLDLKVMKTQEISNVVWSLATLDMHLPEVMDYLLDEACDRIDDCVPQALSNMIWACATLKHRHSRFIDAVAISAIPRLETFQIQTLANTLWAYSVLGIFPEEFFMKAGDELARRLNLRLTERSSSVVNAAASDEGDGCSEGYESDQSGISSEASEQPMASTEDYSIGRKIVLSKKSGEAKHERSSNRNRAASKGRSSKREIGTNQSFAARKDGLGSGTSPPRDVEHKNTTTSPTKKSPDGRRENGKRVEQGPPPRRRRFIGEGPVTALYRDPIYDFLGQEMSNVLISYARGSIVHAPLLKALERELCRAARGSESVCVEGLENFTSQALANTLWAFASLRWYPARLLPCITQAMKNIVHDMTAQELANSLWSYARFAYYPGKVMGGFLSAIQNRLENFEGQGCTNSLWALAVLKATYSAAFIGLLQRYLMLEKDSVCFGEVQYNQVLQAVLLAQFEARGGVIRWRPEVDLPEDVVNRALKAWESQQMNTQLSGFHLDVSEGLTRLGISHLLEHVVARDLLSIDIAVIDSGRRIAIEVDGPFHFPVNARTPLGHTMIRRRLLRAAGWTVMSIPWHEWFELKSWEERLEYLITKLSKADGTFESQLGSTANELLSSDFEPGPGQVASSDVSVEAGSNSNQASTDQSNDVVSQPSLEDGEDGPVLQSYYNDFGRAEVSNGLMDVLSRDNVYLTVGAVRRLESMGLQDVIASLEKKRRMGGTLHNDSSERDGSGESNSSGNRLDEGQSPGRKQLDNGPVKMPQQALMQVSQIPISPKPVIPASLDTEHVSMDAEDAGSMVSSEAEEQLLPKPDRTKANVGGMAGDRLYNPANALYPTEIDCARNVWNTYGSFLDSDGEESIGWANSEYGMGNDRDGSYGDDAAANDIKGC